LKERERLKERRAFSTVLSVLIISAVVLAVGGGIWAFSQSAMTISSEDYAESVINMTDTISERFIIEMVSYESVSVTTKKVIGTGNGDQTVFNLGNFPVFAGSETIYLDTGTGPVAQPDDEKVYILVDETGVITFVSAPSTATDGIKADYKYIINPLNVWIFNYGTVDIEVKVQVKDIIYPAAEDEWKEIPSKDMVHFQLALDIISKEELNVKVYTKRGNNAYYKFFVP